MNAKILIIIAVVGILGLTGFNMLLAHKTAEANLVQPSPKADPTKTADLPLGQQPKATMDKAVGQINQANADTNAKMAQVDNAGGAK